MNMPSSGVISIQLLKVFNIKLTCLFTHKISRNTNLQVVCDQGLIAGLALIRRLREVAALSLDPHTDHSQNPAKSLHCLLGEVTQPNEIRLSETRSSTETKGHKTCANVQSIGPVV